MKRFYMRNNGSIIAMQYAGQPSLVSKVIWPTFSNCCNLSAYTIHYTSYKTIRSLVLSSNFILYIKKIILPHFLSKLILTIILVFFFKCAAAP